MEEKQFYRESQTTKPITLNCPFCRTSDSYDLNWMVRKKMIVCRGMPTNAIGRVSPSLPATWC